MNKYIPYGRQSIDEDDIQSVEEVLRSDWLTTGPMIGTFENEFAKKVGARHAVAFSSGTAALHATMYAIGIEAGDEVIVPPMTFLATANTVVYQKGMPVFADVEKDTLLIDPAQIEEKITPKTRAVVCVDYAGQPCNYDAVQEITNRHGLVLVGDSCHALGASYKDRSVGSIADLTAFSFHPVKHITTGEGGMVTTDNLEFAERMRIFRNHGIDTDQKERSEKGTWIYEMVGLGYNYRITDFQCALGLSQLKKLDGWVKKRREIAKRYDEAFSEQSNFKPLAVRPDVSHSYHLYVILLNLDLLKKGREEIFTGLRSRGIGVNVHYIPVHLQPYYRDNLGTGKGLCPVSEDAYERIISLPIFPSMSDGDVERVISEVIEGAA
ncbi:MAG: UDP-4-amino-4,6-dideoxy-N-acetyl-beta-L-altrosamine transaminase [Deltaproteobacteria bacterium]|uniref:UDP-4-amino-4, 6-dideoxy-N-acetyl-beta-L-altrosamine transaminase n=1 Tax=Candidatus Zymogenus saltonus TaxID=2844893 RepID=A0A9D8PP05_9DELT|nr:UDP-4-amino-4,6-dideoxy-N-acetyl-beta-L-altrosamine transaminase [Candidatus Zymogenus saltonus]